jgi:surface protein
MFCNCSSLEEIDLTSFNTQNVTDMASMFSGCSKLKKIIGKSKASNDKKSDITEINLNSKIQISTHENIDSSGRNNILVNPNVSNDRNSKKNKDKNISEELKNKINNENNQLETNNNVTINLKSQKDENKPKEENKKSEKETILPIFNTSKVENMSCMFAECTSLEGEINLSELENIKNMSFMFYKCENLKKIKLSLRSDYEVDMKNMFNGCECEEYILGNPKIDKNKENIFDMFEDIKYYHFCRFKFTSIECDKEELKDIILIKKWVYICNILLIIFLTVLLIVFIKFI